MAKDGEKEQPAADEVYFSSSLTRNNKGTREDLWNERYEQLAQFKQKHGHCNVPHDAANGLGKWISNLRQKKKRGCIRRDRLDRLTALGMEWTLHNMVPWLDRYDELKAFKEKFGHCNVPFDYNKGLGRWICNQRRLKKTRLLPECRQQMLNQLGLEWELNTSVPWQDRYRELLDFQKEHGHCNVSHNREGGLGSWLQEQRRLFRKGSLSTERQLLLDQIPGLVWTKHTVTPFEERCRELLEFKRVHGHCKVPKSTKGGLGNWVAEQRRQKRSGTLKRDRQERLEVLGFEWRCVRSRNTNTSPRSSPQREHEQVVSLLSWEERFQQLVDYKHSYGHCNIPDNGDDGLGKWVNQQRHQGRSGKLSDHRRDLLSALGLGWHDEGGVGSGQCGEGLPTVCGNFPANAIRHQQPRGDQQHRSYFWASHHPASPTPTTGMLRVVSSDDPCSLSLPLASSSVVSTAAAAAPGGASFREAYTAAAAMLEMEAKPFWKTSHRSSDSTGS